MSDDLNAGTSSSHQLLPFLQQQSQGALTRLYNRPSSCLSVFRYVLTSCQDELNLMLVQSSCPNGASGYHEFIVAGIADPVEHDDFLVVSGRQKVKETSHSQGRC